MKGLIVLFNGGEMLFFNDAYKVKRDDFKNARFFYVEDDITFSEICIWIAKGYTGCKKIREVVV